jgi:hypothetical protein
MTLAPDVQLQLYASGVWNDITADSRGDYEIRRGYADGSDQLTPTRLTFTLNNRDGKYSPRNPTGTYYGQIGRNTPVRLVAGFNTTPAYRSVSSTSSAATSFTCAAPAGVVAGDILIAFQATDQSYPKDLLTPTGGGSGDGSAWRVLTMGDEGVGGVFGAAMRCWWKRASSSEPASYTFAQLAGSDSIVIIAAASGVLDVPVVSRSYVATSAATVDTPTTTPTKSDDLEMRFAAMSGNVTWTPPGVLTERADLKSGTFVAGTLGTRVLASAVATGSQTFTASGSGVFRHGVTINLSSRSVRASAFVNEWPQAWLPGGVDVWAPIEASGVLRRLNSKLTSKPVLSVARREIGVNHTPVAYWPMEEQAGSTQFAAVTTGQRALMPTAGVVFADYNGLLSSKPYATIPTAESVFLAQADMHPATTTYTVCWVMSIAAEPGIPTNVMGWDCANSTLPQWRATITQGAPAVIQLLMYDTAGTGIGSVTLNFATGATEHWGDPVFCWAKLYQQGADVAVEFGYASTLDNTTVDSNTGTTTLVNQTLGNVTQIYWRSDAGPASVGHIAIFDTVASASLPDASILIRAYASTLSDSYAMQWLVRLCEENAVPFVLIGDMNANRMGSQGTKTLAALIQECADMDGGLLFEPRDASFLAFRTLAMLYNQPGLALSYTSSHLSTLNASEDDRTLVNDITVTRTDGGEARSILATGALSILDPPNGVGTYDTSLEVNANADTQLQSIADWLQHIGTVDDPRYTRMGVELGRAPFVASATLTANVVMVDIGDLITVSSPPAWLPPDTINAQVRGITERVSNKTWSIEWNTVPGGAYSVMEWDNTTFDRWDSADTTLLHALTSSATSARLAVAGTTTANATGWSTTDVPYDLRIAGERVTATAMGAAAVTFVAAGVVAHGVNASVVPALPAGTQLGDLLLVFAAIRNSGTGTVDAPIGYTQLVSYGNMGLFGKIHTGTESAPTVSFTGGVALADTSAQMAAFRNCQLQVIGSSTKLNGAVQDIAYSALPMLRDRCLILYLGWKQDDWTSVATLAGATEIGDLPTTTGNDQGLVWDYLIQTTQASIPAGSFTVTGGAVAISRGVVIALAGDVQAATLTRAVNGVAKAQVAGAAVSLFSPSYWAR